MTICLLHVDQFHLGGGSNLAGFSPGPLCTHVAGFKFGGLFTGPAVCIWPGSNLAVFFLPAQELVQDVDGHGEDDGGVVLRRY